MLENIRFEYHPLKNEDNLIVDNYIAGLYNLALCDGDLSSQEEVYISQIVEELNLSEQRLENIKYINFEKNVEALKYDFAKKQIQYTFFCDLFVLALCDGNISEEEFDYIGSLAEAVDLDKRIFQYIIRVAQAISKGTDNAYLLTILSRHKDVSFRQFQFYFGNLNHTGVRNKVRKIKSVSKQLLDLKKVYSNVNYNEVNSIIETFTDKNMELLDSAVDTIEAINDEVEEEVNDFLGITDEDVYSDFEEIIQEIQHLSDMLLVHVGKLVFSQMGLDGFHNTSSDFDFEAEGKALVNEIDKALGYLKEFDTYEELVKKMEE